MAAYPVVLGILGATSGAASHAPLLPPDLAGLGMVMMIELVVFGTVFGLAWLAARPGAEELMLPWRDGWHPLWRGLFYSVALRLLVFVAVIAVVVVLAVVSRGSPGVLEDLRPQTERLIDPQALTRNPLYLVLNLTAVSFVLAGLREELWRAAMLVGCLRLFPTTQARIPHMLLAVTAVAMLFGLGHLPQGVGGAFSTTVLGFGLGVIMLRHHCIWDAVLAHGFFNATSFALLYLIARYAPQLLHAVGSGS